MLEKLNFFGRGVVQNKEKQKQKSNFKIYTLAIKLKITTVQVLNHIYRWSLSSNPQLSQRILHKISTKITSLPLLLLPLIDPAYN